MSSLIHRVMSSLTLWRVLATIVVGETNIKALFFKNSTMTIKTYANIFPPCFQSRVEWLFSRSAGLSTKHGVWMRFYHYSTNLSMDFWKEICTMILQLKTFGEEVFLSQMLVHLWNLIKFHGYVQWKMPSGTFVRFSVSIHEMETRSCSELSSLRSRQQTCVFDKWLVSKLGIWME